MSPNVTAIVLNWCNEPDTAACLDSLADSRYDALTVLLVDNGSPDGSGDRLHARFPNLPYLQTGANLGYAGGNNRGMEGAIEQGADYLLVLNNDTLVDPDCVARLVATAEASAAAVVAPQIRYFDAPDRVWYGGGTFSRARALGLHRLAAPPTANGSATAVSFVTGCCFLIRADTVQSLGGFDESFFAYVEDAELSVRLAAAGLTMLYEPSAKVLHRIAPAAPDTPFQIRQRDRNRRRLVDRHYGRRERAVFALWFYPTRLVHLARFVATGDRARARAIIDGALSELD
ncbi:MAG TPA: glycosyltransferase family 2 protein [Gemmatimonadaceae bacterium]|nr:glycosyltransferase family 2 protein [Gemmatimonadaceae bacterium]